jgi:hypothetical protein
MSYVTTQPEALAAAAGTSQGIGSPVSAQNAAAAAPTTGVVYQAVSAQATAIHGLFVNTLGISSGSYAATEAANAVAAG